MNNKFHFHFHTHSEKKDSHRPVSEVSLILPHRIIFGPFEIKPWFPSPYVIHPFEYFNQHQNHNHHLIQSPDSLSSLESTPPANSTQQLPSSNFNLNQSLSSFLKLYICDGCLKYLPSIDSFHQHKIRCKITHPPGRKVYQSGKIIIREIDGAKAKLYCQCLCLFGKLFIDHKYIFFDVDGFKFYVLTMQQDSHHHPSAIEPGSIKQKKESIMGFFSKEKISYDGYNLACIVTLPPYQKKGYGTLLIAFSYELDKFQAGSRDEYGLPSEQNLYLGTPERPLSTLGAKGYLSFWTSVLVRFFRTLFPPPPPRIDHQEFNHSSSSSSKINPNTLSHHQKPPSIMIEMTLEEISRSTRLRPDDAAFALISSGLTKFRKNTTQHQLDPFHPSTNPSQNDSLLIKNHHPDDFKHHLNDHEVIIITRELVEQVAKRANVKSATLDPRHVLINYSNFHLHASPNDHHEDDTLSSHHSFSEDDDDDISHHLSHNFNT